MNKLNYNEMDFIISEATNMLLNEITVKDAYSRFYTDIPTSDYSKIISTLQGENDKLESETQWALRLYKKKSPRFMEDLYKLHNENGDGYLDIFKRLKTIHKIQGSDGDLGRYKSISELGAFVTKKMEEIGGDEIWGDNAYRQKKNMTVAQKSAKDDIIVQYEDDKWLVITPKSYEASVYWGDGTEWCTAYKDDRKYFDEYNTKGPLFINIDKKSKEKYQFHFETNSFMDEYDEEIESPVSEHIDDSDTLMEFYKTILDKKHFLSLCYRSLASDIVLETYGPRYFVKSASGAKYMCDENFNRLSPALTWISDFVDKPLTKCGYKYQTTAIDINGNIIIDDDCHVQHISYNNDILYHKNRYYGIINYDFETGKKIELLPPKYTNISCFMLNDDGYIVEEELKWANIYDTKTHKFLFPHKTYCHIKSLDYVHFIVTLPNNKVIIVTKNNEVVTKDEYDNIITTYSLPYLAYYVEKNKKFNVINSKGEYIFSQWFDKLPHSGWYSCGNGLKRTVAEIDGKTCIAYSDGRISMGSGRTNEANNKPQQMLQEISVKDAQSAYYKDIPADEFKTIVNTLQGDNNTLLPETKWALGLYQKKSPRFMEDLYKLHNENGNGYLDIFNRAKVRRMIGGQEANLNRFKSISELGAFINSLDYEKIMGRTKGEMSNDVNAAANDAIFPYEDARWKVVIPKSYEASCYWGKDTEWCTATRETDNWYNSYIEKGPLFINIDKQTGKKYQFHFETGSFMDENDESIDRPVFSYMPGFNGLMNFYKEYVGLGKFMGAEYETIYDANGIYRYVECADDGEYIINEKGERLAGPFGYILPYEKSHNTLLAKVRGMGDKGWTFIDINGKQVLPDFYYRIRVVSEDVYACQNHNDGWQIMRNGKKINSIPFDKVSRPCYSDYLIPVMVNNLKNYFNIKTMGFLLDKWVDGCTAFNYLNVAIVRDEEMFYLINIKGERISDFFENMEGNYGELRDEWPIIVRKGVTYNYLNPEGKLVFSRWLWKEIELFDEVNNVVKNKRVFMNHYNTGKGTRVCLVSSDGWIYNMDGTPLFPPAYQENETEDRNPEMTLEEVKYIVHEAARHILQEISVKDAQSAYYKDIPTEDFSAIVQASQGDNNILLPTTKWLLALYKRNEANKEMILKYLPKLRTPDKRGYLDIWDRAVIIRYFEGADSDLNTYRSFVDWVMNMERMDTDKLFKRTKGEWSKAVKKGKNEIKILYEDAQWIIIQPLTTEAACYYGNNTSWCTASRNEDGNYFESYNEDGPLYININKETGEKYQFSIVKREFKNSENETIEGPILDTIGATKGMKEFYKKVVGTNDWETMFDLFFNDLTDDDYVYVERLETAYAVVTRENPETGEDEMNMHSSYGFISDDWFKWVEDPSYYLTFVRVRHKYDAYAIMDLRTGDLITYSYDYIDGFRQWGDEYYNIFYSIARRGDKKGLIIYNAENRDQTIFEPTEYFDYIGVPYDENYNLFKIKKDNKEGYLDINGEVVGGLFDRVHDFDGETFLAFKDGMYNYIDYEGSEMDEWKPLK